ncbi:polysaccharide biosynthesis protein [Devosia sp. Leaf420]|uniref:lipopolysaccharide biosynthesis protein n=1 Tax=Devosia sp. Leaf420 TaxID=1736374 RepID=UPI0007137A55|nr:polysaccharide biosynthesis C-terminal domain-containing protein [Devosia sp. Leaf420]KQT48100.1 polysaccharide biosynthesis protein [Devosia sp. Leaf420]
MFRQVSSYMIANIVSAMFGFASVVIFTRVLAPEQYGIYIVGFSIAAMISALVFGWIKASVVPFTADGSGTDIRVTAGLAFLALLLLIPVLYFGIGAFAPDSIGYLLPAIMLAFGIGFFEFYLETFRARQATGPYMWATIIRAASALGLSLILVMVFDLRGLGLLTSIALSYFVTALLYSVLVWRGPRKPLDPALLRSMLAFGIPMTVSGTVFVLQTMLDRFVLAGSMGEHAAGLYGASADLVRQIMLFPGVAIGTAVVPIAIHLLAQDDRPGLDRHLVDSTEMLLAIMAPAAAGLAIIAGKLAFVVLGDEFRAEATSLIPVVALAWLFRSITYQLLHASFQVRRKPGLMLAQGIITLALNAAALFILVPRFGLLGAAWSLVLSEAMGMAMGYWLTRWAHPLPIDIRSIGKVGLATLCMAVPAFLLDQSLGGFGIIDIALPVIAGVLAYGIAAYGLDIAGVRTRFVALRQRRATAPIIP